MPSCIHFRSRYAPLFLALFFLLLSPMPGPAADADSPQSLAARLQARYEEVKTFAADFEQIATVSTSGRTRLGAGTLAIVKPGRIRWDYANPDRQVLIGDGKKFSMYLAASKQMMIQPITAYLDSDVTYAFFTGTGNILRDFTVLPAERPAWEGNRVLKLVPKNAHPQVDFLHVWFDADFLPRRFEIVDHFGSSTDLKFGNIRVNQAIPAALFSFIPPKGTEIIEQ